MTLSVRDEGYSRNASCRVYTKLDIYVLFLFFPFYIVSVIASNNIGGSSFLANNKSCNRSQSLLHAELTKTGAWLTPPFGPLLLDAEKVCPDTSLQAMKELPLMIEMIYTVR